MAKRERRNTSREVTSPTDKHMMEAVLTAIKFISFYMSPFRKYLYPWFFLLWYCSSPGQTALSHWGNKPIQGDLFIKNFLPEDHGGSIQSWAVEQDTAGLIYVANGEGLLLFDGVRWELIRMPEGNSVRCIVRDHRERIFVAGRNYFGYIDRGKDGTAKIINLADSLPDHAPKLRDVGELHATDEGIYVRTAEAVYFWSDDATKFWAPAEFDLFWSFKVHNEIYDNSRQGLIKLDSKSGFHLVKNGEFFAGRPIASILPLPGKKLMIAMRDDLYEYDDGKITRLDNEVAEFIRNNRLMHATQLYDGHYCFPTLNGGLIVADRNYKIILKLDLESGLPSLTTYGVYQDRRQNLWIASNGGISMVEYGTPITHFKLGDRPPPTSTLIKFQDQLFAGTFNGLYRLNAHEDGRSRFELFEGIRDKIWDLLVFEDRLLIAYEDGIYQWYDHKISEIGQGHRANFLKRSSLDSNRIFVSDFTRLHLMTFDDFKWSIQEAPVDLSNGTYYISEDGDGNLWIDAKQEKIWKIAFRSREEALSFQNPRIAMYDTSRGLPGVMGYTMSMNGEIYYINDQTFEMLKYDRSQDHFRLLYPDELLVPIADHLVIGNADKNHNLWLVDGAIEMQKTYLAINKREAYQIVELQEERITERVGRSVLYDDGVMWHGGNEAIYRYEIDGVKGRDSYKAFISKVRYQKDSILAASIYAMDQISIPYHQNNFRFYFGSNCYEDLDKIEFQSWLVGYEDTWSDWNDERHRDVTNLKEGNYNIKVRARNVYDQISVEDSFALTILPPWYRTWWASLFYVGLGILITGGLVRWRSKQLRSEKLALAHIVSVRTGQLAVQNEQLEDQKSKLLRQAEDLKAVDKLKSRLLANISHEFRTPLSLIKGPLDQLNRFPESQLSDKHIRMMQRNTNRLLRLVNQLLDLSKIDAGTLPLNMTEGNLYQCLRVAASAFSSQAAQRNIDYQINIPPQTIWTSFDRDKMEEVVYNLLSNAFKFTPDEGTIKFECTHEKGVLSIIVSDTGIGIYGRDQEHIFDRFYQGDNTGEIVAEGSGIGLSLVKEFVDIMHGEITMESEPGLGSTFFVQFPIEVIEQGTVATQVVPPPVQDDGPMATKINEELPIVLLVEDNYDMRSYLVELLAQSFVIYEAINGPQGLKEATSRVPDLIVTDIMMPEMDGIQLCEILKSDTRTSHIPVIMLTARSGLDNKLLGVETGADAYLTKPFSARELLATANNLIEQRIRIRAHFTSLTDPFHPKDMGWSTIDQTFISKVLQLMEAEHGDAKFDVPTMQKELAMSKTQLQRKMKALTGQTPGEFLRKFRLKRGSQILLTGENVTQTAYAVGFNNLSYFARCFKQQFGVSPKDYASRFRP